MHSKKIINFTAEQQEIIEIKEGIHLVLAPPGSGKTELLATRVEKAINSGYHQDEIICLTFTNRAAKAMKDRIEEKFPNNEIIIGNIHHYCSQFLFKNKLIPLNTAILDEEESDQILEEIKNEFDYPCKENNGKRPKVYNSDLLKLSTYYRQIEYSFQDDLLTKPKEYKIPQLNAAIKVCKKYNLIKEEYGFIDFDDILTLSYNFLKKKTDKLVLNHFKWLQVDEVQDLNPLQWEITNLITDKQSLKVYFGDYEQAIFSFMGAKLESIHKMESICRYNPNGVHNLQKNFRSPSYLLDIFIDYAKTYLEPRWKQPPIPHKTEKADEDYLKIFQIDGSILDEALFISENILPEILHKDEVTAIIVRYNKSADEISRYLDKKELRYFKISGFDLFRRKSIKGLMAFLSILNDEFDRVSWLRLFYEFKAFTTIKQSRNFINRMFKIGLIPTDFLNYGIDVSELTKFYDAFSEKRIIIFDTEATGLDVEKDDIIQIAAIEIKKGVRVRTFEIYINSNKDLSNTQNIHNITKDYLQKNGVSPEKGLFEFLEFLGNDFVLIAHNIIYDFNILKNNLKKYLKINLDEIVKESYDTLKISKLIYPNLHSYKLGDLLDHLNISGSNSHNAMDDTKAAANLLGKLFIDSMDRISDQKEFYLENKNILNKFNDAFNPLYQQSLKSLESDLSLTKFIQVYFDHVLQAGNFERTNFESHEMKEIKKLTNHIDFYAKNDFLNTLKAKINKYLPQYKTFKESDLFIGNEQILISTVYKAKGLEFDNVIVAEATNDTYPAWASKTEEAIKEDARALYVALSRAKKRLYITYHNLFTTVWGTSYEIGPSPFLEAIRDHFTK